MPIYRGFYSGFHARHCWNRDKTDIVHKVHEEHGESWVSLFIDLVYVAMFMSVGFILEYCGDTADVVGYAFAVFVIMFNSRLAIDTYSNRFFADDLFHRLIYCVYTLGVFLMTLNINYTTKKYSRRGLAAVIDKNTDIGHCPYVDEYWDGFAWGFFITRGSLVMLYACICYQNGGALRQFGTLLTGLLLSMVVVMASVTALHGSQGMYFLAIFIECSAMNLPRLLASLREFGINTLPTIPEMYPKDIFEMQTRLGVFYMMTLGESMIQLLQRVYTTSEQDEVYRFTIFSFLLVFSYGMQYFDAVFRQKSVLSNPSKHAMKRSNLSHIFFVWAHPVLGFYSIYMTVGLTMMYIGLLVGEQEGTYFRNMMSLGACLQTVLMILMRLSHKGLAYSMKNPSRIVYIVARLGIAMCHLSVRYYTGSATNAVMFQALLAVLNNILDIAVAMKPEAIRALHSFSTRYGDSMAPSLPSISQSTSINGIGSIMNDLEGIHMATMNKSGSASEGADEHSRGGSNDLNA